MGCASSVPATADAPTKPSLAKMDQLTSDAYSKAHPPTHWSDVVLLVPHEWLRHEMNAMLVSVQALPDSPTRAEYWKTLNFAKWLAGFFSSVVHLRMFQNKGVCIFIKSSYMAGIWTLKDNGYSPLTS